MSTDFDGVTPHLVVPDPSTAADWYATVFEADEFQSSNAPDGQVWHIELLLAGGRLLLMPPYPDMGTDVPGQRHCVVLHVYVPDTDAVYARALAHGARSAMEPWDAFWGDRYCQIDDPFGHRWSIATKLTDFDDEESRERAAQYTAAHPHAPRNDRPR